MSDRKPLTSYRAPRTWPIWLGMGLLRRACLLPQRRARGAGRVLGRIAHALGGSRRAVVRRNIELCFPDLSPKERDALAGEDAVSTFSALVVAQAANAGRRIFIRREDRS